MNDHADANAVSRVLDDGEPANLTGRLAAQQRVHEGLRGSAPMVRPSGDISARVMMRIGAPGAVRKPARAAAWWPAAIAAGLTIIAATGWYIARPPASKPAQPQQVAGGTGFSGGFAAVLEPLAKSDAAVHASMEAPFIQQARFIRDDTREGMEMVLSRLPMGDSLLK